MAELNPLARMAPDGELAGAPSCDMATMKDCAGHARAALAPQFGGSFDWAAFLAAARG